MLIAIDDLQWADELTLGFLEHLSRDAAEGGLHMDLDPMRKHVREVMRNSFSATLVSRVFDNQVNMP